MTLTHFDLVCFVKEQPGELEIVRLLHLGRQRIQFH